MNFEIVFRKFHLKKVDFQTMKSYAIAFSISVTTEEVDLGEINADWSDFFGHECSRDVISVKKVLPRI